ncbi:MAG: FtsW/RodA/SpoVE family cell cycle protein [Planctomycetota bacterium]|jgi:cell division protein FtsW (lipid II flippase)
MSQSRVVVSPIGRVILLAVAMLLLIGLASIYVTNTHYAAGHDGPHNAAKQLVRILLGLAIGLALLKVGYQSLGRYAYFIFAAALILLVPLLIARVTGNDFGGLLPKRNGAYRWINLPGFPLQPSELMKIAFVLALAWYLRYRQNYRRFSGLLIPLVGSALPLGLILLEPDLGTCLLLVIVLITMLFMAGAKIRHLLAIFTIGAMLAPVAWMNIKDYQQMRVKALLLQSDSVRQSAVRQEGPGRFIADKKEAIAWAAGSGYQLVHSKNAIGSGGLLGYGWGEGMYCKSTLLPDRHNDFIFALIGHQWGLVGCCVVIACYALITLCGILIATSTTEPFARLLAVGITAMIAVQVLINVAMTVGLMPITGMTLPFVSYGGSSLMTNFMAIALLISVSRFRPFLLADRPFEFGVRRRKTRHFNQPGEGYVSSAGTP